MIFLFDHFARRRDTETNVELETRYMNKTAVKEAKEQQSLYLGVETMAAIRGIAEENDASISEVVHQFLCDAVKRYRSASVSRRKVDVLRQELPQSIVNPPDDHLVFGGKAPIMMVIERRQPPRVVN